MSKNIEASFNVELKELNSNLITLSKLSGRFTKTTLIQIRVLRTGIEVTSKGITKKIMDYYKAPESLRQLETLISDLVKDEVELKK